ncbi:MAG: hypothetical protein K6B44_02550 [Lachnospiraceae bacterium]|nr:hypothetical protein [Lachnospiraceae bacterium]
MTEVTMSGTASVEAICNATEGNTYGSYFYNLNVKDSAGLTSKATAGTGTSRGLYLYHGADISGGTVTATGGTGVSDSMGASISSALNMSGGELVVTGSNASTESTGLYLGATPYITGGSISATAGEAATSYGLYSGFSISLTTGGAITAKGHTCGIRFRGNVLSAPIMEGSASYDGSEWENIAKQDDLYKYQYALIAADRVRVKMNGWTYGDEPDSPEYTLSEYYTGGPTISYTGTKRAGGSYNSSTAPDMAGDFKVTVTYTTSGQTGSADFTVAPYDISNGTLTIEPDDQAVYNGSSQNVSCSLSCMENELNSGTGA